ncbi:hypothetical protein ATV_gp20 [Bicaudavirus pozzuoliense]|uniref:Uncharacterized protein ORF45 n=1 Tax=Acidianus two-tailed virus TaxID=315953 RepID=Y045_ATV|nr:hypothetical protein ATV_gp20 [Acidianus two-tailed virus]Q3V4W2.1 RecName: Full=Uncharacterized protein ORF45 [Acidianus two-tailed virus]CAI59852.1 hypothetical protein [Acidianus two-tailed virus]
MSHCAGLLVLACASWCYSVLLPIVYSSATLQYRPSVRYIYTLYII